MTDSSRARCRSRTGRLALISALGVLTALLVPMSPASGDAGAAKPAAHGPAPDAAVRSLAADRGISIAEAQKRIGWQTKASGLADKLAGRADFGGTWIGEKDDRVKVGLTGPGDISAAVTAAGLTGAVDTVRVRYTDAQLWAADHWLTGQLVRVNAHAAVALTVGIRHDLNVVHLRVPTGGALTAAEKALVSTARSRYGDMLWVETVPGTGKSEARACVYTISGAFCDPPLRAGIAVFNFGGCTGGFLARSRSDNKLYQFTAGHCAGTNNPNPWSTEFSNGDFHDIGPIGTRWLWNAGMDAALMTVSNPPGWRARAWIYVTNGPGTGTGGTTEDQAYSVLGTGGSIRTMRVCTAGAFLGVSNCGTVQEVGVAHFYETPAGGKTVGNLGQANFCGVIGDSGAPVFAGHIAYGIQVAGGNDGICDSYYVGIAAAQNAMNVNVSIDGG